MRPLLILAIVLAGCQTPPRHNPCGLPPDALKIAQAHYDADMRDGALGWNDQIHPSMTARTCYALLFASCSSIPPEEVHRAVPATPVAAVAQVNQSWLPAQERIIFHDGETIVPLVITP